MDGITTPEADAVQGSTDNAAFRWRRYRESEWDLGRNVSLKEEIKMDNTAFDPFVEHFSRKIRRHELDPDVAAMLLADYAARDTAVRQPRQPRQLTLTDVGRPVPLKHSGHRPAQSRRTA